MATHKWVPSLWQQVHTFSVTTLGNIRESSLGGLVLWITLHVSGTVHHVLTGSTWTRGRGVVLEIWGRGIPTMGYKNQYQF